MYPDHLDWPICKADYQIYSGLSVTFTYIDFTKVRPFCKYLNNNTINANTAGIGISEFQIF